VAATIASVEEALSDLIPAYELAARANMPKAAFDYFAGGAGDETSLEESRVAWHRHRLRPHAFPGGAVPDLSIKVLETHVSLPVIVAPTAWHQLAHQDGEVETAAGVSATGGLMVVATRSTMVIEDIAAALSGPWWYQVYVVNQRRITEELVRRAVGLGARALRQRDMMGAGSGPRAVAFVLITNAPNLLVLGILGTALGAGLLEGPHAPVLTILPAGIALSAIGLTALLPIVSHQRAAPVPVIT